jgi:hypothetical protein
MNIEEALKDAMANHVADVHASPMMGWSVRRRGRRGVITLRTAAAALVTAAVAAGVPVAMVLVSSPVASVGPAPAVATEVPGDVATQAPGDVALSKFDATAADGTLVLEGVRFGYMPKDCVPGNADKCPVWAAVYQDGATSLEQDGRLSGKRVADDTYLSDGNMIARVLDDRHGVLVIMTPDSTRTLSPAAVEEELIKIAEGLSLAAG